MRTVGVVCEYNPFHLGHARQLALLRQQDPEAAVVCLMSGLYVQRGQPAVFSRQVRARAALLAGADLVLELPVTVSLRSAEGFAAGGVEILDRLGQMPLPPYIHEKLMDKTRYQTVYAREEGSAAAPTAGLHFTPELLDRVRRMGVDVVPIVLHVGLGTFRPVKTEDLSQHHMHVEHYEVPPEAAARINAARAAGGRCVCVGTTSVRTLETVTGEDGIVCAQSGDTGIFIMPGYTFHATDALITNFHLPQSTLLMLISALMGREEALRVYREAVKERYRFFSFGDAMLIL